MSIQGQIICDECREEIVWPMKAVFVTDNYGNQDHCCLKCLKVMLEGLKDE